MSLLGSLIALLFADPMHGMLRILATVAEAAESECKDRAGLRSLLLALEDDLLAERIDDNTCDMRELDLLRHIRSAG